jgi:hypothetical protein
LNPHEAVGFYPFSSCVKLAINFEKKDLLNFLSKNIDQDRMDDLLRANLYSFYTLTTDVFDGSWGDLAELINKTPFNARTHLRIKCKPKEFLDFVFNDHSIMPSKKCIDQCFGDAIDLFNKSWERVNKIRHRKDTRNHFIHNLLKLLLHKCKEKGINVDEDKVLDMYVRELRSVCVRNLQTQAEHSCGHVIKFEEECDLECLILDMIADIPFSKAVYEKNSRLSAYLDDNKLSDKEFYKIMQIRTKDGGNAPFAEYLIERYLQGKHDVSPQAMDNVMKNSTVDTGGKIGIGGLKRLSKKPHLPVSGWPQSKDVMQHISEYNGNSRIEPDLLNRVKTYRESQRVKGIVHQPVAPKEMANQVEENKE